MHLLIAEDLQLLEVPYDLFEITLKALLNNSKCDFLAERKDIRILIRIGRALLLVKLIDNLLSKIFGLFQHDLFPEVLAII